MNRCRCGHPRDDHHSLKLNGRDLFDAQPCSACDCPDFRHLYTETVTDNQGRL